MKRTWRSALVALLTLALCVAPVAGFAEGAARLKTLTFGNLTFALGKDSGAIEAELILRAGTDEEKERGIMDIQAMGGLNQIGRMQVAYEGETLKGWLDGMSNAYALTKAELTQLAEQMKDQMQVQTQKGAAEIDPQLLTDFMAAYAALIAKATDPEAAAQMDEDILQKMEAALAEKLEQGTTDEEFEALGEKYTGKRAHIVMGLAEIDKVVDIACASNQEIAAFFDAYFKLLNAVQGAKAGTMSELYAQMGMAIQVDMTIWADAIGENTRMEMAYDLAVTEDGETVQVMIPMTMELSQRDGGTRMVMTMQMEQDGTLGRMNFAMDEQVDEVGSRQTVNMLMDVAADGETVGQMKLDGLYALTNAGAESFSLELQVVDGEEEMLNGRIGYEGTVTETQDVSERKGHVTLTGKIAEFDDTLEIGFDMGSKTEPMTDAAFDQINTMPVIQYAELTQEALDMMQEEAQAAMVVAMGAMLQTPGVAELLSKAMTEAQKAEQAYLDNYDSYSCPDSYQTEVPANVLDTMVGNSQPA